MSSDDAGAVTSTCRFGSVLLIWGWIELRSCRGRHRPERGPCPARTDRLGAVRPRLDTPCHHELLLLLGLFAVAILTTRRTTPSAFWTYLILFVARISAKLNLFFGVPRINTEFVPRPLRI